MLTRGERAAPPGIVGEVGEDGCFGKLADDFLAEYVFVANVDRNSLAGGGDLGAVDLIYVPEPSMMALLALGFVGALLMRRQRPS